MNESNKYRIDLEDIDVEVLNAISSNTYHKKIKNFLWWEWSVLYVDIWQGDVWGNVEEDNWIKVDKILAIPSDGFLNVIWEVDNDNPFKPNQRIFTSEVEKWMDLTDWSEDMQREIILHLA